MKLKYEDFQPQDWQERHSPTTEVRLHDAEQRLIGVCRRRVKDSKIWEKLEYWHLEREAVRVCRAYHFITFGRGCRTSRLVESYERSGMEAFLNDVDFLHYLMRCKDDYVKWALKCQEHKISREAILDLLYFNIGINEVEASYHKRHGWAISNMVKGLRLYV